MTTYIMCNVCTCFYRILNPSIAIGRDALTAVTDYEQVVTNVNLAMNLSQTANFTATLALQQVYVLHPLCMVFLQCVYITIMSLLTQQLMIRVSKFT